jgi:FKBP-type peptidyl-prolyl cis-trans isomerase
VNFSRIVLLATGLVALGLVLARVLDRESDNTDSKDKLVTASIKTDTPSPEPKESEANSAPKAQERLNTTVKTKDLSMGSTKKAELGSQVSFHVIVQLMDGKVVFDSRGQGQPWTGTIGDGSLLNGIDRGIRGMFQGGKRAVWIPSRLAYGTNGISGQVPPNADLYAEVELIAVY